MRITIKGWWTYRDLGYLEAEAYHLREAAKYAGSPFVQHQEKQEYHLKEARRNRVWGNRGWPMPAGCAVSA